MEEFTALESLGDAHKARKVLDEDTPPLQLVPFVPREEDDVTPTLLSNKRKRSGPHIVPKLALNAMAQDAPLQIPSSRVPHMATWMTPEAVMPLSTQLEFVKPKNQSAYGCSDPPTNQLEHLLADMNRFMPLAAALRVGPYTVPLHVVHFVVDKTGRFLALVTCPWSASHRVFCLFHFFKNLLHLLHQMDKDDRLERLRQFGDSQVSIIFFCLNFYGFDVLFVRCFFCLVLCAALSVHPLFHPRQQSVVSFRGHLGAC